MRLFLRQGRIKILECAEQEKDNQELRLGVGVQLLVSMLFSLVFSLFCDW